MPISRDFDLRIDEQTYIELQSERFLKMLERPAVRSQFEDALNAIGQLARPAACWEVFPIEKFLHEKVQLQGGVRLGGGPVVTVTGGSEELIVAVCTLGPEVDAAIHRYHQQGDLFKMVVLDEMASWAIDQVRLELCGRFEAEATAKGWRVSAMLSPGESAWSVEEQKIIFSLLDASPIGVTLSPSCVMTPVKSLSLIMGTGRHAIGVEGASNCDFCTMRDRCQYRDRREKLHSHPAGT